MDLLINYDHDYWTVSCVRHLIRAAFVWGVCSVRSVYSRVADLSPLVVLKPPKKHFASGPFYRTGRRLSAEKSNFGLGEVHKDNGNWILMTRLMIALLWISWALLLKLEAPSIFSKMFAFVSKTFWTFWIHSLRRETISYLTLDFEPLNFSW